MINHCIKIYSDKNTVTQPILILNSKDILYFSISISFLKKNYTTLRQD